MANELPFTPFPLFPGSHQQTIIGSFYLMPRIVESNGEVVLLPDDDVITIEVSKPENWKPEDRTVVMVHGLCGSHGSPYMIRMAKKLSDQNIRAIRVNLRGCGSGKGLSKKIYHSGRSEDVLAVLNKIKKETPHSPITLIGFSLGGNIVLKLVGELNSSANHLVEKVIAVGPPVELYTSVCLLQSRANQFYHHYFLKLLKEDVEYRHKRFKELGAIHFPETMTLFEFDTAYTAPQCGFENAMDYYKKSSSMRLVPEINIPCQILLSEDDPLISSTSLDELSLPEHIQIYKTKNGGHLGFLGIPGSERGFHWMDSVLLEWINNQ